jgi:hypothetical protein
MDVRTTRGCHGSAERTLASVTPSPSGSSTSTRHAAGLSCTASASAARTPADSPTTVRPLATSSRRANSRNAGSSSTTRTERVTREMIDPSLLQVGRESRKSRIGRARPTTGVGNSSGGFRRTGARARRCDGTLARWQLQLTRRPQRRQARMRGSWRAARRRFSLAPRSPPPRKPSAPPGGARASFAAYSRAR